MEFVPRPDFRPAECWSTARNVASAYAGGRGSFRLRASISIERERRRLAFAGQRGPLRIAEGRLIEQVAALIADKKLPILPTCATKR